MNPTVATFTIVNFLLMAVSLVWSVICILIMILGSMEPGGMSDDDLVLGLAVWGFFGCANIAFTLLYLITGSGMVFQKHWAFTAHMLTAGLTLLNPACFCLGIIYTIPALVICAQHDVQEAFKQVGKPVKK